jgi:hypothetical protein
MIKSTKYESPGNDRRVARYAMNAANTVLRRKKFPMIEGCQLNVQFPQKMEGLIILNYSFAEPETIRIF